MRTNAIVGAYNEKTYEPLCIEHAERSAQPVIPLDPDTAFEHVGTKCTARDCGRELLTEEQRAEAEMNMLAEDRALTERDPAYVETEADKTAQAELDAARTRLARIRARRQRERDEPGIEL